MIPTSRRSSQRPLPGAAERSAEPHPIPPIPSVSASRRMARFAAVGVPGFGIQLGALEILMSMARWPWLPATIVAVQLAVVHNFLWHERWTWRDRTGGRRPVPGAGSLVTPLLARFARFNAMTGVTSIAGNAALMAVYAGVWGLPAIAANTLAVGTLSLVNFVMSDRWVFCRRTPAAGARAGVSSRSFVNVVPMITLVTVCVTATGASAAPAPDALAAWNRYIADTDARIGREQGSGPEPQCRVRVCDGESISIPSGTISRWRGSVFLPGVSLEQVLHRLQYPGTPPPQEDVASSRVLSRTPDSLHVYIRLVRRAIVTLTYDTEHEMRFQRVGPFLATARSEATRIVEVGGDDHGFLWRLNSYWRYRQTRDGVEVELESLTLSRHVPAMVRPVAAPIVARIARESVVRTLEALRNYFAASRG